MKRIHSIQWLQLGKQSLRLIAGGAVGVCTMGLLHAGPYPPAHDQIGSSALASDDPAFVMWASAYEDYRVGDNVDLSWQTPAQALGPAVAPGQISFDIVSLGRGGAITLLFNEPIADGPGFDFAVFENSFSTRFLELAFVEVSSDGIHFYRFYNDSLTLSAVGSFGIVDATNVDGFAGKYATGYGTPFDLSTLPEDPLLNTMSITHVKIIDVIGGVSLDSSGDLIYDPSPTIGSAGFDLDAVGVIHKRSSLNQTGYQAWADGASFDGDTNGDQIDDGLAWLLGAATPGTNATRLLPSAHAGSDGSLTLTFSCRNEESRGGVAFSIQHSSDLGRNDPWTTVAIPDISATIDGIRFTITQVGDLNHVEVMIPASEGAAGTVFCRLFAEELP